MKAGESAAFEPETIELMRVVLDGAWESLTPYQQALSSRTTLAERILAAAALGERDPVRLRGYALNSNVERSA
ncbi:MAG: hypothetical protein ACRECC_00920 [Pseudolabrys sp.]|jgi:hypothetical protein